MEKGKVVVIDDSPIVRKLAQLALEEEGYTVYTAEDGEQGYRVAEEIRPSLILVDFIMPKVSGYQVCKMVRENEAIKDTPIILITGKGDEAGRKFTEKFGILDYFVKPFRSEALIEKVNSILRPNDGFSLDDVASLDGIAGIESDASEAVLSHFETADEPAAAYGYDQFHESPADPSVGFDCAPGYSQAVDYQADLVTGAGGEETTEDLVSEVTFDVGNGLEDPAFPTAAGPSENLFEQAPDFDPPVSLIQEAPVNGDDSIEIPPLVIPEEFPEVLSDMPDGTPESDGQEAPCVTTFTFAPEDAAPIDTGAADVPLPGAARREDSEVPETVAEELDRPADFSARDGAETHDAVRAQPFEPTEEPIERIVSRAVDDSLNERASALMEGYDDRVRSLLGEMLEGGPVEAAVERVLSRHFSTTLPSILQDKTAEALTLLKDPPGEGEIERIVERVLSRHFKENLQTLIRETTGDIRNDLSVLPGRNEIAATIESTMLDSEIYTMLPALEGKLAEIREDMKSLARQGDISDSIGRALRGDFPEDFAASLKDGIAGIRSVLDEMPRFTDIEKLVEDGLSTHLPVIVQSLLNRHAAEVKGHVSGLAGRADIEGILADFAAQSVPARLLPEFTQSLEDMLKQHGLIKAPGIILSGDAAHLDLAQVLAMVSTRGLTGRLSVYSVSLSSEIYLHEGTLCYASTSRQGRDPLLGKLLSPEAGHADGLTPGAREILRNRIEAAVHDTLSIREGKFYFERGPVPDRLRALSLGIDPALCFPRTPVGALTTPAEGHGDHYEGYSL